MDALGSSFISCTALGVQIPVTLIVEFPQVVASGACLRKLFLVISVKILHKDVMRLQLTVTRIAVNLTLRQEVALKDN